MPRPVYLSFKIVEKDNRLAVHSVGYSGREGKKRAQARIDRSECALGWLNKGAKFIVMPEEKR